MRKFYPIRGGLLALGLTAAITFSVAAIAQDRPTGAPPEPNSAGTMNPNIEGPGHMAPQANPTNTGPYTGKANIAEERAAGCKPDTPASVQDLAKALKASNGAYDGPASKAEQANAAAACN